MNDQCSLDLHIENQLAKLYMMMTLVDNGLIDLIKEILFSKFIYKIYWQYHKQNLKMPRSLLELG